MRLRLPAFLVRHREFPVRRFVVADRSMEPGLVNGDGLIAWRSRRAKVGQRRVLKHPERTEFWLVKRVSQVIGDSMVVHSDNAAATLADSRSFGSVPVAGSYRVLLRIPRRFM